MESKRVHDIHDVAGQPAQGNGRSPGCGSSIFARCLLRPLCLIYCPDAMILAGWCGLRNSFRYFRVDWFEKTAANGEAFSDAGNHLRERWRTPEGWSPDYPGVIGHG